LRKDKTPRPISGNSDADWADPELIEKAMDMLDSTGTVANQMSVHGMPCHIAGQLENRAAAGNLDR
jgi:hypothetical protein